MWEKEGERGRGRKGEQLDWKMYKSERNIYFKYVCMYLSVLLIAVME